ncbi:MAG TPA: molybdopterin-dependent oxidoreductase, partial [Gemmataceae bacterium]|nr:molybdopterin-dependent oxidoreductase [Gemmataceae bacterium]
MLAGPATRGTSSACCRPGAWTAITATPTSARRGARFGYAIWQAYDRPSPDHANAEFILLISAHLESGHYFNPHAQRIIEGKLSGAKLAVIDTRLSNTASMADYWLPTRPGTEATALLAMARVILEEGLYDAEFLRRWVNWEVYLQKMHPPSPPTPLPPRGRGEPLLLPSPPLRGRGVGVRGPGHVRGFVECLKADYARFTPQYAEAECGVPAATLVEVARRIGRAGHRFAAHNWRGPASGHLGGWQIDPTGQLGVRRHFESPYRPGEKITVDEYYRYIFERVPGLPEATKAQGLDPLAYMRKYGAFQVHKTTYRRHERQLGGEEREGTETDPVSKVVIKAGKAMGIEI